MATTKNRKRGKTPAQKARTEARTAYAAQLSDDLDEFLAGLLEEHDGDEDALAETLAKMVAPFAGRYSDRNILLVLMQKPDATDVRGYVAWNEAGRAVRPYPEGEQGITIIAYRGGDKDKDAKDDAPAEPGTGKQPGEISSDDLKTPRKFFSPDTVHDISATDPTVCGTCGEPIRRVGKETREQMQARGGRRQAALWTHTTAKPADGHTAVRLWNEPAAAAPAA